MKTQLKKRHGILAVILSVVIVLMMAVPNLYAAKNKDLILVLDTSLSMAGYGGKSIMSRVKNSLPRFIDQLEEDDSITFITFDTDVKVYPRIVIEDDSNRDVIKKYISMVEAKGKWTYTMRMIRTVFATAQKLEDEYPDRERVIVVLTDALDDPPPWQGGSHFNIKSIAEKYSGKEWFIHFVSLGNLKQNKKVAEITRQVKENVSEYTSLVETRDGTEKGISEDLTREMTTMIEEKRESERMFFTRPWFIAILVILFILVILYFLKKLAELKVRGKLEYWNNELLEPYIEEFNLTSANSKSVFIGRGVGNHLNIRDFDVRKPVVISADRESGEVKCTVSMTGEESIEFKNREPGKFLQDGDIFKVANYTFKYYEE
ncbi:MAG TPA: vWA domain-containing protein [Spirochaetota bacterium]|nr:vWA domain-containing protein [Spirochaetota bacterium]